MQKALIYMKRMTSKHTAFYYTQFQTTKIAIFAVKCKIDETYKTKGEHEIRGLDCIVECA